MLALFEVFPDLVGENVVLIDENGNVSSNKSGLGESIIKIQKSDNGDWIDQNGEIVTSEKSSLVTLADSKMLQNEELTYSGELSAQAVPPTPPCSSDRTGSGNYAWSKPGFRSINSTLILPDPNLQTNGLDSQVPDSLGMLLRILKGRRGIDVPYVALGGRTSWKKSGSKVENIEDLEVGAYFEARPSEELIKNGQVFELKRYHWVPYISVYDLALGKGTDANHPAWQDITSYTVKATSQYYFDSPPTYMNFVITDNTKSTNPANRYIYLTYTISNFFPGITKEQQFQFVMRVGKDVAGWTEGGQTQIFKRMTSIAQMTGDKFDSGSDFRMFWQSTNLYSSSGSVN